MEISSSSINKWLYALLFLVIIPVMLWFWAVSTESLIRFPTIKSIQAGIILAVSGISLMAWGMYALKKQGKGLPMNAFPPPKFVNRGPYRIFHHPIYVGFGLFMTGVFIWKGSASGLWMVTPCTIFGMVALVWGYEKPDLEKRFPGEALITVLHFPENRFLPATLRDRLVVSFWILFVLCATNFSAIVLSGNTPPLTGKTVSLLPLFESPLLTIGSLLFLLSVPFWLKEKAGLFEWGVSCITGLSFSAFIAILYPEIGAQYFKGYFSFWGDGFRLISPFITVPVFIFFIAVITIYWYSRKLFPLVGLIAAFFVAAQLSGSRSLILHILTSVVFFLVGIHYHQIWNFLRDLAERIANSWHEWVFGKVRIINHGFYAGLAAFVGIFVSGVLAGKEYAWVLLVFAVTVTVFSAVWAQLIEGSEKLKRPFGFYGAMVGILFASLIVWAMGYNGWVVVGVASSIMPWVQAVGRVRCLVNGCCHGSRVSNPHIGIRYFHPRSRVCGISGLKGEPIHPTPLYSILWLFFVGLLLLELWSNHFSPPFIFGLYLILTGLGRFVEEAYRGEVQTLVVRGLRIYQWIAIASVILGMAMSIIRIDHIEITPGFGWDTLFAALIGGLFIGCAMGVDFPLSDRRFSRLV